MALLAVLLVAQPVAGADYPDMETACSEAGGGEVLIGVLPGPDTPSDGQVLDDTATLYAGTTLKVALCKDGELANTRGSEWSLADSPGLETLGESQSDVTVRVTGDESETDVPSLVEDKDDLGGVSIRVQRPPTAESELADGSIAFGSADAASAYAEEETAYLDALADYSNATERLNDTDVSAASDDPENSTEELLDPLNESNESVVTHRDQLEDHLYESAWNSNGGANALVALETTNDRKRAADADAREAKQNYLTRLESAESDALSTVLLNLVGAAVVGLVVGGIPGWKLTASKLEDIRYDRQVNSSVTYGPRVLARAGGLALVALLVTAAALFALGGLTTLGGLL